MCSCLSFTPPSPPTFHKSFYLSIHKVLHLPVNLLVNKTTYLSTGLLERLRSYPKCPFICLSSCLRITCLSTCMFIRLSVCLYTCLSMPCFPNYLSSMLTNHWPTASTTIVQCTLYISISLFCYISASLPSCVQSPNFLTSKEPRNRSHGINSASLCILAGRYDNPIPTRFLAPIDCL
jgi:hypothetical protein